MCVYIYISMCVWERETERERARASKRARQNKYHRERVCVCMCVFVCAWEGGGGCMGGWLRVCLSRNKCVWEYVCNIIHRRIGRQQKTGQMHRNAWFLCHHQRCKSRCKTCRGSHLWLWGILWIHHLTSPQNTRTHRRARSKYCGEV